jgi:hypothetical protein
VFQTQNPKEKRVKIPARAEYPENKSEIKYK